MAARLDLTNSAVGQGPDQAARKKGDGSMMNCSHDVRPVISDRRPPRRTHPSAIVTPPPRAQQEAGMALSHFRDAMLTSHPPSMPAVAVVGLPPLVQPKLLASEWPPYEHAEESAQGRGPVNVDTTGTTSAVRGLTRRIDHAPAAAPLDP